MAIGYYRLLEDGYRERYGKWLLDRMGDWDRKCVWVIIWLQDIIRFWDIYRKMDGK